MALQVGVECIRLHPESDLEDSLKNNVAVLKLGVNKPRPDIKPTETTKTVRQIVNTRSALETFNTLQKATGLFSISSYSSTLPTPFSRLFPFLINFD